MTDRVDREEVERLAKTADLFAKAMKAWQHKTQKHNEDVRDTLRALLAERDALMADKDALQSGLTLEFRKVNALEAENQKLREVGQAVVDRWDTPLWKEAEATGRVINRLRAALAEQEKKDDQ